MLHTILRSVILAFLFIFPISWETLAFNHNHEDALYLSCINEQASSSDALLLGGEIFTSDRTGKRYLVPYLSSHNAKNYLIRKSDEFSPLYVIAPSLKIRNEPKTGAEILGDLKKGDVVSVPSRHAFTKEALIPNNPNITNRIWVSLEGTELSQYVAVKDSTQSYMEKFRGFYLGCDNPDFYLLPDSTEYIKSRLSIDYEEVPEQTKVREFSVSISNKSKSLQTSSGMGITSFKQLSALLLEKKTQEKTSQIAPISVQKTQVSEIDFSSEKLEEEQPVFTFYTSLQSELSSFIEKNNLQIHIEGCTIAKQQKSDFFDKIMVCQKEEDKPLQINIKGPLNGKVVFEPKEKWRTGASYKAAIDLDTLSASLPISSFDSSFSIELLKLKNSNFSIKKNKDNILSLTGRIDQLKGKLGFQFKQLNDCSVSYNLGLNRKGHLTLNNEIVSCNLIELPNIIQDIVNSQPEDCLLYTDNKYICKPTLKTAKFPMPGYWADIRIPFSEGKIEKKSIRNLDLKLDFSKINKLGIFQKHSILSTNADQCEAGYKPHFSIESISLCDVSENCSAQQKYTPSINKNIGSFGWKDISQIPNKIVLNLTKTSNGDVYSDKQRVELEIPSSSSTLDSTSLNKKITPLIITSDIEYDTSADLRIYNNMQECTLGNSHEEAVPFQEHYFAKLEAKACSVAKVMSGNSPKSFCTRSIPEKDRSKLHITERIIPGKRALLLVDNSRPLEKHSSILRNELVQVFQSLHNESVTKGINNIVPFDVMTIDASLNTRRVLSIEDFQDTINPDIQYGASEILDRFMVFTLDGDLIDGWEVINWIDDRLPKNYSHITLLTSSTLRKLSGSKQAFISELNASSQLTLLLADKKKCNGWDEAKISCNSISKKMISDFHISLQRK